MALHVQVASEPIANPKTEHVLLRIARIAEHFYNCLLNSPVQ